MFPLPLVVGEFADGLLCDVTVEGIQKWIGEIGESCCPGVEPMERVADPSIVSALLSLVLASRNKLAALGYNQVVRAYMLITFFIIPQLTLPICRPYRKTHSYTHIVSVQR